MKQLSLDQIKTFLSNLANAIVPGSKLCLCVENTSIRNKFYICLHKDGGLKHYYLVARPSYNSNIAIAGLDPFIAKANPLVMFRPNQILSIDKIVETMHVDEEQTYNLVMKSIRKKINNAIDTASHQVDGSFYLAATDKHDTANEYSHFAFKTQMMKSFNELLVYADLHAN